VREGQEARRVGGVGLGNWEGQKRKRVCEG
jgi:hypothetical protein